MEKDNITRKIAHLERMTMANGCSKWEEQIAKEKILLLKQKLGEPTVNLKAEKDEYYEKWKEEMVIKREASRKKAEEMMKRDQAELKKSFNDYNMKQHFCQWGDLNEERNRRMDKTATFSNKAFI